MLLLDAQIFMKTSLSSDEIHATLRLQCIPNIGDITAKKLIAHCGSPTAIFNTKPSALHTIPGIGSYALRHIADKKYALAAEKEFNFINANGVVTLYFEDLGYPNYLKQCVDGPIVLFQDGNVVLDTRPVLSVIGTRKITTYGTAFCEQFIEDIAPLNPIIVSGFAYGVDIAIQKAAINHGLQTIGCLAHGLNQTYPKAHKKYVSSVQNNGGFLTEFWSTSNPERENFLKRNRIIAGMAEATVVVESAEKGGSLVTADIAHSYNRDVFAVPGRATDVYSRGCNTLIKQQKAQLITSAADVIYLLGWNTKPSPVAPVQKQLFLALEGLELQVHTFLTEHGKQTLDAIAVHSQIPIFKVSSTLLHLEMKGAIRPLPGKLFEVV